jgi:glycosyltransferase involved in cell wall biosynthesis
MPEGAATKNTRILVAGTFDPEYARNRVILALLARGDFIVDVVNRPLWSGERHTIVNRRKTALALRAVRVYAGLLRSVLRAQKPDAILVLYPGHFDMPVVAAAARIRRIPVLFDPFISLHDTISGDRALRAPDSILGRIMRRIDQIACRLATLVLADTPEHADYFSELTKVPRSRFRVLWVGAPEDVFRPVEDVDARPNSVLFYGTFIPLQGVDTIVKAAKLLEADQVHVRLVGNGQERPAAERLVEALGASNVEFADPVAFEQLPNEIAGAVLCLGIFGTTAKAQRVIPNKLFQCIAVGRPVVTADTPAIRSAFSGEVAVTPPGNAQMLAATIRELLQDEVRREALAKAGRARFLSDYSEAALAQMFTGYIEELMATRR